MPTRGHPIHRERVDRFDAILEWLDQRPFRGPEPIGLDADDESVASD